MVRRPAQQERDHHGYDHPHGPVLLETASVQQPGDGHAVAGHHDSQRDQKAKNVAKPTSGDPPTGDAANVKSFCANEPLGVLVKLEGVVEKGRQSEAPTEGPDRRTQDPAALPLFSPVGLIGMHNHKVPIDTDASQEDYAGVEVCFYDQVEELAHEVAKEPSPNQRYCEKWERQGHESVCYCQVEQVDVWWSQNLSAGADHPSYQQVAWDRQ